MRNLSRLDSYAIAAAAVSASIVASANAAVVSSGAVSIAVPTTTAGVYLNVITGQTGAASFAGYDVNIYGTGLSFFSSAASDSTGYVRLGSATTNNTNVANLASGVLVGNLGGMWFGNGSGSTTAPAGFAFTLNSANNFVGFRFVNEATNAIHYGYVRLSIGATLATRTITEYAYESVAGASILVPAPGAVALLGVAGLAGARRRRR